MEETKGLLTEESAPRRPRRYWARSTLLVGLLISLNLVFMYLSAYYRHELQNAHITEFGDEGSNSSRFYGLIVLSEAWIH